MQLNYACMWSTTATQLTKYYHINVETKIAVLNILEVNHENLKCRI